MRELAILLFRRDPYVLAVLTEEVDSVGEAEGGTFLKIKGTDRRIPVDDVLDLMHLPVDRIHSVPDYVRRSFRQDSPPWSSKSVWGIVQSEETLFPIVSLKALAEGTSNEEP